MTAFDAPLTSYLAPSFGEPGLEPACGRGQDSLMVMPQLAFGYNPDQPSRKLDYALAWIAEAQQMIAAQKERIEYLESLTTTDELTGLNNRRGFLGCLRRELASARRSTSGSGVLVMIDLDGFKGINDTHGHPAGDAYLREIGRQLTAHVRAEDVVARLGGDEFAVLLTHTDVATGEARAAELAAAVSAGAASWNGHTLPLRFSYGTQAYGANDQEDEVIRHADAQLYRAKRSRGRVRLRRAA
ncbi:hypothetical protein WCLP8_3600018 [uncultured Gammaproteobacteria bacterium]